MTYTEAAPGFDTLSYARRLRDGDVGEKQAEAHAEAVRDLVVTTVATKADVARLEDKMDGMATKAELYRALWVQTGAIMVTLVTAFAAAVGIFITLLP